MESARTACVHLLHLPSDLSIGSFQGEGNLSQAPENPNILLIRRSLRCFSCSLPLLGRCLRRHRSRALRTELSCRQLRQKHQVRLFFLCATLHPHLRLHPSLNQVHP